MSLLLALYLASGRLLLPLRELAALFLVVSFGYAVNDIFDAETDRIAKPDRVIPAGVISRNRAILVAVVCVIGGLTLAAFADMLIFYYFAVLSLLLFHYAYQLSAMLIAGNLLVALLCSSVFYLGGILGQATGSRWQLLVAATIFAFLHHLGREIIKDIEDAGGDRQTGRRTIAIVWGEKKAAIIGVIVYALLITSTYLLYALFDFSDAFLFVVTVGVNLPIVLIFAGLLFRRRKGNISRAALFLKLTMIPGLAALLLAR